MPKISVVNSTRYKNVKKITVNLGTQQGKMIEWRELKVGAVVAVHKIKIVIPLLLYDVVTFQVRLLVVRKYLKFVVNHL